MGGELTMVQGYQGMWNIIQFLMAPSELGPEFKITTLIEFRIILGTTQIGSRISIGTTLVPKYFLVSTIL
jgi:hypothetical protein